MKIYVDGEEVEKRANGEYWVKIDTQWHHIKIEGENENTRVL